MTREEADFIGGMNMCDEISNEAYKKIVCHCEEQEPCEDAVSRYDAVRIVQHNNPPKALEKLRKLPPVTPMQRWVPVSERLPEKNMKCLVAVGRFNFTEIATYSDLMGIINHKIFYQGEVGHDSFKDITQYVKAWMPLTEPYKAGSEE